MFRVWQRLKKHNGGLGIKISIDINYNFGHAGSIIVNFIHTQRLFSKYPDNVLARCFNLLQEMLHIEDNIYLNKITITVIN